MTRLSGLDPNELSHSALRRRGWSEEQISALLGQPDEQRENPFHPGSTMRIYRLERVLAAEQSGQWHSTKAGDTKGQKNSAPRHRGGQEARSTRTERTSLTTAHHLRPAQHLRPARQTTEAETSNRLAQIELRTLAFGSTVLPGRIRVSYRPGVTGDRMLRADGHAGWITAPGSGKQGQVLGAVEHVIIDLRE